jgi:acetyltransferase-like isoleucine patch superfamily enzyme
MSIIKKIKKYGIYESLVFAIFHVLSIKINFIFYNTMFILKSKIFSIEIGKGNKVVGNVYFGRRPGSIIQIGGNFNSVNNYKISFFNYAPCTRFKTFSSKSKIIIGNNVHVNSSSILCNSTMIVIGDNTLIAPNCILSDSNFHNISAVKRHGRCDKSDKPIIIKENVWIGMNTIVLKGVVIGKNSVISANSLVIADVKPNSMYAGNPAKFIKKIPDDL